MELLKELREDAEKIFASAVHAVDPYVAVKGHIDLVNGSLLTIDDKGIEIPLERFKSIWVVGGGKASAPMAKALEEILKDRIRGGIVNVKYGFVEELRYIELVEAGHPVPDGNGLKGTEKILRLLRDSGKEDLIISVISGGGSALLPLPAEGITLQEKQQITKMLLACGASIDEINTIRKHISLSKGGQMARAAYPASVLNLMLSDVVGDSLEVIASGPFVPDNTTFLDARKIIDKYGLRDAPESILRHIEKGVKGEIPDTPKPGDSCFNDIHNVIIGNNLKALKAASKKAEELGYRVLLLSSMIQGESREVARAMAGICKEVIKSSNPFPPPLCILAGGETTVTLRGDGKGGRNQEFCLQCAIELGGMPERVVILSGGTDGNDGPTDAAGGIVDPLTVSKGIKKGLDAMDFLIRNDSYNFLNSVGDLLITGPTKTNVMDVIVMLIR